MRNGKSIARTRVARSLLWTFSLATRTPVLVVLFTIGAWAWLPSAASPIRAATGLELDVLAILTLLSSVVIRLSLGSHDIEFSDLKEIRKRANLTERSRESLALYFGAMIVLSIVLFGVGYFLLWLTWPSLFTTSPLAPDLFDWIYYSAGVVSTSTDGTIVPNSDVARLIVFGQLCSGPLLLFWFVSLFLTSDGDRQIA